MKRCNSCEINVDMPVKHCPLCYTNLVKVDENPEIIAYPDFAGQLETYNLFLRILIFLSISIIVISITINLLTPIRYPWSLIVTASIVYIWIALGTAIRRSRRIGFNIMVQLINLSILLVIFGNLMRFQQTVYNAILPALCASAVLSFDVLAIVKRKQIHLFLIYFLIVCVLGFVPLLLWVVGLATVGWPGAACAVYSSLSLVSIFLFADRVTKTELRKRLHL